MPRQVKDQPIQTKTQRAKLAVRGKPYWRRLSDALSIGYRRTATLPGVWVVRKRQPDGSYSETKLKGVSPDDVVNANGADILSFDQACALARTERAAAPDEVTLKQAAEEWRDAKIAETDKDTQKTKLRNTAARLTDAFPEGQRLDTLTKLQIEEWRDSFVGDAEGDAARARRATANRELATFKAICARAIETHKGLEGIAQPWVKVKKFAKQESFGKRLVTLDQKQRAAWVAAAPDEATAAFLRGLLMTGCRSGELATARVGDLDGRRLTVRGKTGERTIVLSPDAAEFFAGLAEGSNSLDRALMLRADRSPWLEDNLIDQIARATKAAKLPAGVTAYAARHSYIADHLKAGVPIVELAKQCGTSAAMIEQTYSSFLDSDREAWFSMAAL